MSNVVLIRFTCFAVFLLRLFNFCLLYLFIYFLLPYKMVKQVIARERPDDDMPPADGSSTVAEIAADLRPSADGSAVRTSLVAGGD